MIDTVEPIFFKIIQLIKNVFILADYKNLSSKKILFSTYLFLGWKKKKSREKFS
jgi:hypothetical protein